MSYSVFDQCEDEFTNSRHSNGISGDDERIVFRKTLTGKNGDERPQKNRGNRHQYAREIDVSAGSQDQINAEYRQKDSDDLTSGELLMKNRYCHKRYGNRAHRIDQRSH